MCIRDRYRLGFNTTDFETGLEIVKNLRKKDEKQFLLRFRSVSYTHLRAHETVLDLVCRLLLEKKKTMNLQHI